MSPEMIKFLGLALVVSYPFHVLRQRKEAKILREPLFIDYADSVFTRSLWHSELQLHGSSHSSKEFPPKRLVQIIYAEAIDSLGFADVMRKELKGVSLKKLKFLRALHIVCVENEVGVQDAIKSYPKHRLYFEKLRETRRRYFRDSLVQSAISNATKDEQEKLMSNRIDLSQKLRDKTDLMNWLIQHGPDPDFWHVFVCNTDPNQREDAYHWIVSQPQCDAGTAAQIFHHSNAYEALAYQAFEFPSHLSRLYSTAKMAADRWTVGNFQTHRFAPNDIYSSTTYEDFKNIEAQAIEKFGTPAFRLSEGLFDDKAREMPKTDLYFTDF